MIRDTDAEIFTVLLLVNAVRAFRSAHPYNPIMRLTIIVFLLLISAPVNAEYREFLDVARDPSIATKLRLAAEATHKAYPGLKKENLAISVVDMSNPSTVSRGDHQGDVPFYPASVIKLFFMADVYATKRQGVPDAARALKEMIVVSDNDATAHLVDILAGSCAGPSLEGRALERFIDSRRAINRRFQQLGYADTVSAMMKPWSFAPYGREMQLLGPDRVNRNKLTANATASLLLWIVRRRAPEAHEMMSLMERPLSPPRADENQVKEFIGEALPTDARLWSKGGWTSEVRLDAAYVELPQGQKLILVIFTRGISEDTTIIPAIARNVLAELQRWSPEPQPVGEAPVPTNTSSDPG
jgi:hypothetical protein